MQIKNIADGKLANVQNERRVEVFYGKEKKKTAIRDQSLFITLVLGAEGFSAKDSKMSPLYLLITFVTPPAINVFTHIFTF